ncbi:S24 family peptidase [Globicatella sanguinis]
MKQKETSSHYEINKNQVMEDILFISQNLISPKRDIFCLKLTEESGFLPHQLPHGALIFVDKNEPYKKGDFIVINDNRLGNPTYRIIKSLSNKDKDFVGKIIFQIQKFD